MFPEGTGTVGTSLVWLSVLFPSFASASRHVLLELNFCSPAITRSPFPKFCARETMRAKVEKTIGVSATHPATTVHTN